MWINKYFASFYPDYRTGTQYLHAHDSQRTKTEEDTKEKELDREEHDTETNQSIIKDLTLRLFYRIYHLMSKALITAIISPSARLVITATISL